MQKSIRLRGCHQHNLRNLNLEIPLGKLTVVTGPSGSGKSSLAFHTLYAEGQRRYVETFSPYVRQFFDRMDKPDVDSIEGIPPAIAIEQKNHVRSTRSTVGTLTEIHDYLKLFFARCATGYDPKTGEEIRPDSVESAAAWIMKNMAGTPLLVTFPIAIPPETQSSELFPFLNSQGYLRILLDGEIVRTDETPAASRVPHVIDVVQDRLTPSQSNRARLHEALETAFHLGKGSASVATAKSTPKATKSFSTHWTNPSTGFSLRPPSPALFSFNSPLGACPHCRGFGRVIGIDLEKAVPDSTLSIAQGAIRPFQGDRGSECQRDLLRNCRERGVDINTPWDELTQDEHEWIYYGDHGISTSDDDSTLERLDEIWQSGGWYGVKGFFDWLETKSYKMHVRVFLSRYRSHTSCPSCRGKRLQPESLCYKIDGRTLPDLSAMPICDLLSWFHAFEKKMSSATSKDPSLKVVLNEIHSRLHYLNEVGLGYLTLDRQTRTLSGGEVSRVNLTACLGASLTGTLFVLDEPTVGLHPRDVDRLTAVMHLLRDKGNTLVVVEHENAVMRAADHLLDLGPAAGQHGGELIYHGPPNPPPQRARTLKNQQAQAGTLPWLIGEKSIPVPENRRRPGEQFLKIRGASCHNLRKLDVDLPLGVMTCLTGVSGSGKSTLAHQVIYENVAHKLGIETQGDPASVREILGCQFLNGIEMVDQSAVARTPRSTPALFLGAFDPIRQLFACTSAAKAAGVQAGFFSFNSGDGRCDRCAGNGFEKVEMQFLSDLYVSCPACDGRRYKPSTLEFLYRGKSIHDILSFTVAEAISFYQDLNDLPASHTKRHLAIIRLLTPLVETGLGYLKLGQPLNTLSGGESQRLKLCQLLQSSQTNTTQRGGQLLILDEPTTGLHFSDIDRLLKVFHHLADLGHTLLVIEHNLDVIKSADWIIDLGPEAGNGGGQVVACGPPEDVAKQNSPTGRYLQSALAQKHAKATPSRKKAAACAKDNASLISLRGARHHNLKNLSLDIPRDQLVVISGLSGSGKSTLAFDILFAEGQRRFLDSMSTYARQFAEQLEKPEIDQIQGLPPTVAIEQRVSQGGRKSTVATVTEIWNFIRLLYAKLGTLHCPDCQVPVEKQSLAAIENTILKHLKNGPVTLLAPVVRGRKGYHTDVAEWALKQGFSKLLVDRQIRDTDGFKRLERFKEHDIDIVIAELVPGRRKKGSPSLGESVAKALEIGKGILRLITPDKKLVLLSTKSSCPSCNRSFDDLDPRIFSFNSPQGWCPDCRGHGLVPNFQLHLDTSRFDSVLEAELDADRSLSCMNDDDMVECPACHGSRLSPTASSVRLIAATPKPVGKSHGKSATPADMPIADLARCTISAAAAYFANLSFASERDRMVARDILPQIRQRLDFLREVGLGYLQLDRSGNTLSGGESQRIRLAAQLGSNLRGVLYVLDEPSIGLHPRDNSALLSTLLKLRDQGNSVVVVEHDEETISAADHLIDLGPAAGCHGGELVYQGKPPTWTSKPSPTQKKSKASSDRSPTLRAFANPLSHPIRGERRAVKPSDRFLKLTGCYANNLKDIDLSIPIGRLTVLTGVSGSGKSTLMRQCLAIAASRGKSKKHQDRPLPFRAASGFQHIHACYEVDQSPIGKTSRSCPATYVKVFDQIRALFAQIPEARMRGFPASRFSFNTEGGRCSSCKGNGRVKLEMDFLPATWVPCEDCGESRYEPTTLEVLFHGKDIGEVLAMNIDEAASFFESQPRIAAPLRLMADTGLGYLKLGQASPTLSGGEAQRIKLVSELIKGRSSRTRLTDPSRHKCNLYLIEEPTVGLHHEDIRRLIDILHRLVDEGHTVVVIEHHMAVAAEADWIIDIGPEAGSGGGQIVANGPPEKIAKSKRSHTAAFLKSSLGIAD